MKTKELSKPKDSTRLLLDRIISWEKDLNEYPSLESILREQFIIYEREEGAGFINGMFKKREQLEAERSEVVEALKELYKYSPDIPVPMGEFSYGLAKAIKDAGTLLDKLNSLKK